MCRNYSIVDARSVGCCGYYSREGLVGDRAEVGHGEAHSAQSGVKFVERDAGFGSDEAFVFIDLFCGGMGRERDGEKGGNGRLAVVPERDLKSVNLDSSFIGDG